MTSIGSKDLIDHRGLKQTIENFIRVVDRVQNQFLRLLDEEPDASQLTTTLRVSLGRVPEVNNALHKTHKSYAALERDLQARIEQASNARLAYKQKGEEHTAARDQCQDMLRQVMLISAVESLNHLELAPIKNQLNAIQSVEFNHLRDQLEMINKAIEAVESHLGGFTTDKCNANNLIAVLTRENNTLSVQLEASKKEADKAQQEFIALKAQYEQHALEQATASRSAAQVDETAKTSSQEIDSLQKQLHSERLELKYITRLFDATKRVARRKVEGMQMRLRNFYQLHYDATIEPNPPVTPPPPFPPGSNLSAWERSSLDIPREL
ncbi:hypothetical protein O1611_g445 [Lasiodiplodia mahajangana]|uniref:Uncharacterized protein n=1 Tax=Lasiodiplodia mahajangana TaxID=1108764 RepID=A0ACC2K0U4_9PEZI|nr:hypothetical protein O1611_g445 [Lasiodiplodia mahajangana]